MPPDSEHTLPNPEQSHAQLAEALSAASRVTVEIGTGRFPLFKAKNQSGYDRDNLYVGLNVDPKQHEVLKGQVADVKGIAVLAKFDDKTIETLPILEDTTDMVYMANVFGEPDSEFVMYDFQDAQGKYRGNSSIDSKIKTLHEAARILKEDGQLVIVETNTPYLTDFRAAEPYEAMVALLKVSGFDVLEAVDSKDERWSESAGQFTDLDGMESFKSYVVVATKTKVEPLS